MKMHQLIQKTTRLELNSFINEYIVNLEMCKFKLSKVKIDTREYLLLDILLRKLLKLF